MNSNCAKVMKLQRQHLPDEIILYILTFLPLSSLFKFKCVSKLWNTLFLHPHFSYFRQLRGLRLEDVKARSTVPFTTISRSSQGLYLQETSPLRYRVWCRTSLQSFAIPNPENPSICMALEFVQSSQAVKLVSVHEDEYSFGYEILALGIGIYHSAYTWLAVKVPPLSGKRKRIEVFFRKEVAYCICYVETEHDDGLDIEVDVLDMVNEGYIGHTTFPRGGCSTNLLDWNGRLSFAQLLKDELFILVLNDYRNLKWAERIIKLTFLKPDNKELFTFFTCVDKSILFFMRQDKKSLCAYDIYTRKLTIGETCLPTEEVAVHAEYLRFRREAKRLGIV